MVPARLLHTLRLIEAIPITYMVTGSIAAILYGKPRLTHDMDIVIVLAPDQVTQFCRHFPSQEFYCPEEDVIRRELTRGDKGQFNLLDQESGFKIDVYLFAEDPLVAWGLKQRKHIELLPGESVWVAPPEYVIVKKLEFYREGGSDKHLDDIRGILEISGEQIDQQQLNEWIKERKLLEFWAQVSSAA